MPGIVPIAGADWERVITQGGTPSLVWFETTWCSHCVKVRPILERIAQNYLHQILVCSVDGDTEKTLVSQWGVRGYPTVIAFNHGVKVDVKIGEQDYLAYNHMAIKLVGDKTHLPYSTLDGQEGVGWPWNADQTASVNSFTLTPYRGGLSRLVFAFDEVGDPHLTLTNSQGLSRTMRWADLPDHLPHEGEKKS